MTYNQYKQPKKKTFRHNTKKLLNIQNARKTKNLNPKTSIHPNNAHSGRYDLVTLSQSLPELSDFIILNPSNEPTIDFANPMAVKTLNKALLIHFYNIKYWDIPEGFLCPPIPSRADYIHHVADVLAESTTDSTISNGKIHVLDIGTGANMIYPIIGSHCYDWHFTATDIDPIAIENAQNICDNNPALHKKITLRQQQNPQHIFKGIIKKTDKFTVTLCNPPFHASMDEAIASNSRKRTNLANNKKKRSIHNETGNMIAQAQKSITTTADELNFGGQKAELWCGGGEINFLQRMAKESFEFNQQVQWFTTLVSKAENVYPLTKLLKKLQVTRIKEITMTHGQKTTRIIVWGW